MFPLIRRTTRTKRRFQVGDVVGFRTESRVQPTYNILADELGTVVHVESHPAQNYKIDVQFERVLVPYISESEYELVKPAIATALIPGCGGGKMMASTAPGSAAPLSDAEHGLQLRRAVVASTIGTAIEWYDFFLYGVVTATVFAKLYFPNEDPLSGTLSAFGIYAVGFVARPVGAAIFGYYGDRIGRKAALIATLVVMGVATFLVAFVPGYSRIGIWGAVILTILRFIQGVGVGGEWGGSVLLSMEWAKTSGHRGFIASWPQFGVPCGLFLANLAFLVFNAATGHQFLTWGWRVPFALSIVLVGVGLYIRLGILETPTFSKLVTEKKIERQPIREVIKRNPKEIILAALVRLAEQAPFYIFTTYVFAYGTGVLQFSREFILWAVLAASLLSFVSIPLFGHISDRIGRRNMYVLGAVTVGLFGFIYFDLLNTGSAALAFIAIFLSLIPHDMMYGPQAAFIAESFTGRLRYSGASLGYQLASVIAGGPAPLIATWLYSQYRSSYAIALYILVCAVITLIAAALMKDYTGKDIEAEMVSAVRNVGPTMSPTQALVAQGASAQEAAKPPSSIGSEMSIVGTIECRGLAHIFGRVEGELHASELVIGEGAQIDGNVVAENVTIRGRVKGTVRGVRIKLQGGGAVEGDIFHRSLSIEESSLFEGSSRRVENPLDPSSGDSKAAPEKPSPGPIRVISSADPEAR